MRLSQFRFMRRILKEALRTSRTNATANASLAFITSVPFIARHARESAAKQRHLVFRLRWICSFPREVLRAFPSERRGLISQATRHEIRVRNEQGHESFEVRPRKVGGLGGEKLNISMSGSHERDVRVHALTIA